MVSDASKGSAARSRDAAGSEALQRLRRGELTVEEYLDTRVDAAVARLGHLVTEEERDVIRDVLREQALVDPVVQHYVRQALGRTDEPSKSF